MENAPWKYVCYAAFFVGCNVTDASREKEDVVAFFLAPGFAYPATSSSIYAVEISEVIITNFSGSR